MDKLGKKQSFAKMLKGLEDIVRLKNKGHLI